MLLVFVASPELNFSENSEANFSESDIQILKKCMKIIFSIANVCFWSPKNLVTFFSPKEKNIYYSTDQPENLIYHTNRSSTTPEKISGRLVR